MSLASYIDRARRRVSYESGDEPAAFLFSKGTIRQLIKELSISTRDKILRSDAGNQLSEDEALNLFLKRKLDLHFNGVPVHPLFSGLKMAVRTKKGDTYILHR